MASASAARRIPGSPGSKTDEHIPLVQSRETGEIIPESLQIQKENPFAKSWAHFVAGG